MSSLDTKTSATPTLPAAAAVEGDPAAMLPPTDPTPRTSTSTTTNRYGVGCIGVVVGALCLSCVRVLMSLFFEEEKRKALHSSILMLAHSRVFFLACGSIFFLICLSTIHYNAHLAHTTRLERFLIALVMQQRQLNKRRHQKRQNSQIKDTETEIENEKEKNDKEEREIENEKEKKEKEKNEKEKKSYCCCDDEDEDLGGEKIGVLFVTAHPDDESMFFSPSLSFFSSKRDIFDVFVLCLSTGIS